MTRNLAVVLTLLLVPAGCGLMPAETPNLDDTSWRAVLVAGKVPVAGSEPTVIFQGGMIRGSTGCNRYSGPARIEGNRLTVGELTVTLVGCAEPLASSEKLFMEALAGSAPLRLDGGNLVIVGPAGEVVLRADSTVR